MIRNYLKFYAMKIYSELFICINNGKTFAFCDSIVSFMDVEGATEEPYGVLYIIIKLREDGTHSCQQGVSLNNKFSVKVRIP